MLRIILIHPGATDFDEQRRIKGSLSIPLNANGAEQAAHAATALAGHDIDCIYVGPCQSAHQTAEALLQERSIKIKTLDKLKNLDHGLWHGKTIDEVRQHQPKVYRQWQDHPEQVCPPDGESVMSAQLRVRATLVKLLKKHKSGTIAIIVPNPLVTVLRSEIKRSDVGDLWKSEQDYGSWELLEVEPEKVALSS